MPSFGYNPADKRFPLLFELNKPLTSLSKNLLVSFAGQTVRVADLYDRHNVGTPFVMANYRTVINTMEADRLVTVEPPAAERRMYKGERSLPPEKTSVTFPPRS